MPQPFGSSGGQLGTGRALTRETETGCETPAMWAEAKAPVATRERAKMRAMSFMVGTFRIRLLLYFLKSCCTKQLERQ
jgi:hypothetical protein